MLSKSVNTKSGLETEWEEVIVFVERNQIKCAVSQTRALLKVPCASRNINVCEPNAARESRCGYTCHIITL
jgi:hypothetical protein